MIRVFCVFSVFILHLAFVGICPADHIGVFFTDAEVAARIDDEDSFAILVGETIDVLEGEIGITDETGEFVGMETEFFLTEVLIFFEDSDETISTFAIFDTENPDGTYLDTENDDTPDRPPQDLVFDWKIGNEIIDSDDQSAIGLTPFLDILPGSPKNVVSLKSKGFLRVAVLSTVQYLPLNLDDITFGDALLDPVSASPERVLVQDVNRDGIEDLVLFFRVSDLVEAGAIDDSTKFIEMTMTFITPFGNIERLSDIDRVQIVGR